MRKGEVRKVLPCFVMLLIDDDSRIYGHGQPHRMREAVRTEFSESRAFRGGGAKVLIVHESDFRDAGADAS